MIKAIKSITRQDLAYALCMIMLSSMFFSKYVLSVSMFCLVALAVFDPDMGRTWKKFLKTPPYLVLTLLFFLVLLNGLYSENLEWWLGRLRIKLPYLILPFAFAAIKPFNERQFSGLLYLILVLSFLGGCLVLGNYMANFDSINLAIEQSRAMPTPVNHIRFSLLIALGIIAGLVLVFRKYYFKFGWERRLIFGITTFLIVFIHILSVRSGIITLYVALVVLGIRYILVSKRYLTGGLAMVFMMSIPVIAYYNVSTFKTKVDLVLWNYYMFKEGNYKDYSDTRRIISYQAGLNLLEKSPVFGVGAGDVKDEVYEYYNENYQPLSPMLPHNEYLFILVGSGIIGFAIFLFVLAYPFFYGKNYKDPFFLGFYIILLLSFLVENTIENSIGAAFHLVILLISLNYLDRDKEENLKDPKAIFATP